MWTRVDPPSSLTPPRQAEASDARMAIRKDEENPLMKRGKKKPSDTLTPEDLHDAAVLAVPALIDFLQGFLKSLPEGKASPDVSAVSVGTSAGSIAEPSPVFSNPDAARAASAYQHVARSQQSGQSLIPEGGAGGAAQNLLSAAEVRTIHALIARLVDLQARGVVSVELQPAPTFLDALVQAAHRAG